MSKDYTPMWAELGLDLEKHAGLLAALGRGYGETFLSQRNRPKGGLKVLLYIRKDRHFPEICPGQRLYGSCSIVIYRLGPLRGAGGVHPRYTRRPRG